MKKCFILLFILFSICLFGCCNHNKNLNPGDFGYVIYNDCGSAEYTYINDSIVMYNWNDKPIINIHTCEIIGYAKNKRGKIKVKGDDNNVNITY